MKEMRETLININGKYEVYVVLIEEENRYDIFHLENGELLTEAPRLELFELIDYIEFSLDGSK